MRFGFVVMTGVWMITAGLAAEHGDGTEWIDPPRSVRQLASVGSGARAGQDTDLPEGEGKKILQASCTACHDLTEVTKFKGYLTRAEWGDIVRTMVEYGAVVKPADVDVLVDYLVVNLGKKE